MPNLVDSYQIQPKSYYQNKVTTWKYAYKSTTYNHFSSFKIYRWDHTIIRDKTRILVTHGITYLPKTDHIVVLKEGKISEQGSYQELVERKGDFAHFLLEYMTEMGDQNEEDLEVIKVSTDIDLLFAWYNSEWPHLNSWA